MGKDGVIESADDSILQLVVVVRAERGGAGVSRAAEADCRLNVGPNGQHRWLHLQARTNEEVTIVMLVAALEAAANVYAKVNGAGVEEVIVDASGEAFVPARDCWIMRGIKLAVNAELSFCETGGKKKCDSK